ncbi:MAG TPA: NAD(P)-dependent oxidoreductase, partial [Thermoanaerobaculia bacterium]|nr:NAD(P)-dependent oxidoreductase [Thermoanaerobaculia bacterium]
MQNVLITGTSGFVGGHLFERFRKMGWNVTGLGRRATAQPSYVQHDLAEPLTLAKTFDVVIHAAARASPWGRRSDFERQNVLATQNVIEHCVNHGIPKLVFISSSSVFYGPGHQYKITEETPMPEPAVNDYAATKREAEELVKRYPGAWAILRPRAVFGPGDTVLLPRILQAARAGRLPLLTSSDGPAIGDLIYIDNLVDCIVSAATNPEIRGCYNLTNNEPVPLQEFLFDLFTRLDIPLPQRHVSVRTAMFAAGFLELVHRVFLPTKEPPITRFGIHVMAYSKTF